ncbi:TPA: hypothetical protein EYP66_12340 [Candidatus Poribacteria bacterium]|nr:hypothetical protein [Candidatus Poribacteria bacterium]
MDLRNCGWKSNTILQTSTEQTVSDYYMLLLKSLALLHDGHTRINLSEEVILQLGHPPVKIRPIEGKAIIVDIKDDDELQKEHIQIGSEIVKIDGYSVPDVLAKDVYPYICASTQQALEDEGYNFLLIGNRGTKVSIDIRDVQGQIRTVTLTRNKSLGSHVMWTFGFRQPLEHKIIDDDIAYFALNTFGESEIRQFDCA